jgi:hypothetical protein
LRMDQLPDNLGTWQAERADAYPARMEPILAELRAAGITSFKATAKELTRRGVPAPRGHAKWSATQARRVIERLARLRGAASRSQRLR